MAAKHNSEQAPRPEQVEAVTVTPTRKEVQSAAHQVKAGSKHIIYRIVDDPSDKDEMVPGDLVIVSEPATQETLRNDELKRLRARKLKAQLIVDLDRLTGETTPSRITKIARG